jgi:hypothetical protein
MPSCSAMLKGPQHISVFLPHRSSKSVSKLKSEQPRGPRRAIQLLTNLLARSSDRSNRIHLVSFVISSGCSERH